MVQQHLGEDARLALTNPDAFEFVSVEFTTRLSTTTVIGPPRGIPMAGIAAADGHSPDQDSIVQVTYIFCRLYQHNFAFTSQAEKLLEKSGWTSLDQLYALLN
jgi:hypothetical protein